MHQSHGFHHPLPLDHGCLLKRFMYGLKQALPTWHHRFNNYVATIVFSHNISNNSLFIYHHGNNITYIFMYMDDIILTTSSNSLREYIMSKLNSEFTMKYFGPLNFFLGISFAKHSVGLFLSHKRSMHKRLLNVMLFWKSKPTLVNIETNLNGSLDNPYHDPTKYCSLAGASQYLTFTRPYMFQQVCLFMHDPKTQLMFISKWII